MAFARPAAVIGLHVAGGTAEAAELAIVPLRREVSQLRGIVESLKSTAVSQADVRRAIQGEAEAAAESVTRQRRAVEAAEAAAMAATEAAASAAETLHQIQDGGLAAAAEALPQGPSSPLRRSMSQRLFRSMGPRATGAGGRRGGDDEAPRGRRGSGDRLETGNGRVRWESPGHHGVASSQQAGAGDGPLDGWTHAAGVATAAQAAAEAAA